MRPEGKRAMSNGDALELMKASHHRSQEAMRDAKGCTPEGHRAVVDGIMQNQSDSEIIYFALQELPEKIIQRINGNDDNKPPPRPTISGKPNTTKFKLGDFEITTNQVEVANSLMRVLVFGLLVAIIILGPKLFNNLENRIMHRVQSVVKEIE